MDNNTLIERFFDALRHKDSKQLNSFLAKDTIYTDPIMGQLEGDEVRYFWQSLCEKAQGFTLECKEMHLTKDEVVVFWESSYVFYATQNKVKNNLKSTFKIKENKIKSQHDEFDYSKWIKQAIGNKAGFFMKGKMMQISIQKQAKLLLKAYTMSNKLQ